MDWYNCLKASADNDMDGVKTVAVVIFRPKGDSYEVCIGKQVKGKPSNGRWVLPGGHVEDEKPIDAACRELMEEVGIKANLFFCDRDGTDAMFFGIVSEGTGAEAKSDLSSLTWVPVERIPKMAWDQKDAVLKCLEKIKEQ